MEIVLGQRYRDQVSLFEGIAVSRHQYLYACDRVTLQNDADEKGVFQELTVDVPALEKIEGRSFIPVAPPVSARTGGDRPTPARPEVPRR